MNAIAPAIRLGRDEGRRVFPRSPRQASVSCTCVRIRKLSLLSLGFIRQLRYLLHMSVIGVVSQVARPPPPPTYSDPEFMKGSKFFK